MSRLGAHLGSRGQWLAPLALAWSVGCGAQHASGLSPTAPPPSSQPVGGGAVARLEEPAPSIASLFSHPPDLVLTLRPQALARDRVYGPLLRRASEMASAYAGPTTLGTTALGVLERADEVVVAENGRGREAVIVMRGVPASLDPAAVVDTNGRPIWRPVEGDVRTTGRELAPVEPSDAALFAAPGLVWVIASGPAIGQARSALLRGADGLVGSETPLLALAVRGDALVTEEPRLRQGALASIGTGLVRAVVEVTPGTSGLILGRLTYATAETAAAAESTAEAVAHAFHGRLERASKGDNAAPDRPKPSSLDWLGAASVAQEGLEVTLRVPIPRRWLDAISRADLQPLQESLEEPAGQPAPRPPVPRPPVPLPTLRPSTPMRTPLPLPR